MRFTNYRKETSERSDASNWAKKILAEQTELFFDAIEGCNENTANVATHMMERARVDMAPGVSTQQEVLEAIINLEGRDALQRKINFAKAFHLPLTYVLYCDENEAVFVYTIKSLMEVDHTASYDSYQKFSNWIQSIKGWRSTKPFREREDLPYFDKALRKAGCAWPTNIDCFISDKDFNPIGILEFQNARNTEVLKHCNNEFFLGKFVRYNKWGYPNYDNDIRRWQSQEILRVQSGLRLFIVTWSQQSDDYILKEVDIISFPDLPFANDWELHKQYQELMHRYASSRDVNAAEKIKRDFSTYQLVYSHPVMRQVSLQGPLSGEGKTFPLIYYRYKNKVQGGKEDLPNDFLKLLSHK